MAFTKKAALELQERIGDTALKNESDSLFAGTFHSFFLDMINSYKYFEKDTDKRTHMMSFSENHLLWISLSISPKTKYYALITVHF